MTITSIQFVLFLIPVVLAYFIISKKYQWVVLLAASYIFYASCGYRFLVFIAITTISTFFSAILIFKEQLRCTEQLKAPEAQPLKQKILMASRKKKRHYVLFSLLVNFGLLLFFKYSGILGGELLKITGNGQFSIMKNIVMPLGISFYIFQSIGYVIDVYRSKHKPEPNILKFALFISFFPQLIQGPISRYQDLAPQLFERHSWNDDDVKKGVCLILWGLFKKMIIADRLAILVGAVVQHYPQKYGSVIFFSMLVYSIQIYCDFSGGIDMIRGVASIFSINLVKNFRQPFFATTIADFWRRWHITLGSWMRDYVFYPLSLSKGMAYINRKSRSLLGAKAGKVLTVSVSSLVVYILIGLWHGPSLKYVVFGLWHGALISLAMIAEGPLKAVTAKIKINTASLWWRLFQIGRTTLLVCIGRYFSRADTLHDALSMLKRTVVEFHPGVLYRGALLSLGVQQSDYILIAVSVLVLILVEIDMERGSPIQAKLDRQPVFLQVALVFVFICFLVYFGLYAKGYVPSRFIYMQY